MNQIWGEAPMEGSVLSFLKAEWKVSDTGSAHWASSFNLSSLNDFLTLTVVIFQKIDFYLYIIYMAIYVQLWIHNYYWNIWNCKKKPKKTKN
jgi:hypothetical protein